MCFTGSIHFLLRYLGMIAVLCITANHFVIKRKVIECPYTLLHNRRRFWNTKLNEAIQSWKMNDKTTAFLSKETKMWPTYYSCLLVESMAIIMVSSPSSHAHSHQKIMESMIGIMTLVMYHETPQQFIHSIFLATCVDDLVHIWTMGLTWCWWLLMEVKWPLKWTHLLW